MAVVERLGGLTGSYADGVFFSEQRAPGKHVRTMIVQVDLQAGDANMREVRTRLAAKVKAAGGNALVSFSYAPTAAVGGWGAGVWRGSGYIAKL